MRQQSHRPESLPDSRRRSSVHQDGDVLEFFLDQGEIMTELSFLLARERSSII